MTYKLIDREEIEKALSWLSKYWNRPTYPDYYSAGTIDEAVAVLDRYGEEAKIIAGGIDIVGLIKNKILSPRVLINIKHISSMKHITEHSGGVSIGSVTLINDIEKSRLIKNKYPILVDAASSIGSPQIRNMATIGGNLCQDVRCWYYRRSPVTGVSFNCRRKNKDGICYAVNGENQYHAIIGGAKCVAVCPSDMATALSSLDAKICTVNTSGGRTLSINELYTTFGNTLESREIIQSLQIPHVSPETKQRFQKFRFRKTYDFAIVSLALVITQSNNTVSDAKIVLGGVSIKPYRALKAEELLIGERVNEKVAANVAEASIDETIPLSKNDYKVHIIKTLVKRALLSK